MTTPSEPVPAPVARRLHPLSWLFVLLSSLREYALPLLAALVFGRRSEQPWELLGLAGGAVLALYAVVVYYSYRFTLERDELLIRSGVFRRQLRHIPFRRIHNVTVHQGPLHRLLGVAEVKLESAGGVAPEAHMRVLRLDDARALEALVRQRGAAEPPAADSAPPPLLALNTGELVRLGLISNRGMVVVAAVFGLLAQSGSGIFADLVERATAPVAGWAGRGPADPLPWLAGALVLFALAVAALRMLSVALAIFQFHGFTLRHEDGRVQVDGGLLSRLRASAPLRRIQAWHLHESLLHRWFGRRSLEVDTVGTVGRESGRSLREVVPVADPARIDALVNELLPGTGWPDLPWRPAHPRAWRRLAKPPVLLTVAASGLLGLRFGPGALWLLTLVPWWLWRARRLAAGLGYAVGERLVAVRVGWLDRHWRFAEIARLQGLRLGQSPFDRRHGMATLWLDTAGAGGNPMAPALRIRYLPEAEARALQTELGRRIAATRLRW